MNSFWKSQLNFTLNKIYFFRTRWRQSANTALTRHASLMERAYAGTWSSYVLSSAGVSSANIQVENAYLLFITFICFGYFWLIILFIEPVSAKAPTLSVDTKWSGIERRQNASFAILCPAQAYPVPAYRLVSAENTFFVNLMSCKWSKNYRNDNTFYRLSKVSVDSAVS